MHGNLDAMRILLAVLGLIPLLLYFSYAVYPVSELVPNQKLKCSVQPEKILETESQLLLKENNEKLFLGWDQSSENVFVYLHGFSASRKEITPVVERLSEISGSPAFFTRLTGHGLKNNPLENVHETDWIQDATEALCLGLLKAKRVHLIGTSTGATLALILAYHYPKYIQSLTLLSANFQTLPSYSKFLANPLGPWVVRFFMPEQRTWSPQNPETPNHWHTNYPSMSLVPLMDLLRYVNTLPLEKIKTPVLFLYSEKDRVVDINKIQSAYEKMGSKHKKLISIPSKGHVLAGEIKSPETTDLVIKHILNFINSLAPTH